MYLCFWWGTLFLGYGFWDCLYFSCLFMSVLGWFLTSFYTLDMVGVPLVVNRGDEIRGWWEGACLILEGIHPYCCSGLKFVGEEGGSGALYLSFFRSFCSLVFGSVVKVFVDLLGNKTSECRLCEVQILCLNRVFIRDILRILGDARWVLRLK